MGEVYKASDTRLNRTVAIKVLPPHFADDPEMKQRFEREAQTIAGLNHPHICTLHDIGEQDGVRLSGHGVPGGRDAGRSTRSAARCRSTRRLRVAGEIVDALDKAHQQGVVHRDLKPRQHHADARAARSSSTSDWRSGRRPEAGIAATQQTTRWT